MMTMQTSVSFELKSIGPREFEGYGAVFGNVDHGGDIVLPGAFAKTLQRHKADGTMPLMFWMHQPDQVPGVWLDMAEDRKGLHVKGEILDTALGRDVHTLLQKKAVRGLSIGYRPTDTDYDPDGNRLLKQVEVAEVSIVSMAMNPLARVEAAKARLSADGEYVPTAREFEDSLRKAGYSRRVALLLTSKLFDGLDEARGSLAGPLRDSGADDEEKQLLELIAGLTDRIGAQALHRF
jgi:HK97 family phage prohead protease